MLWIHYPLLIKKIILYCFCLPSPLWFFKQLGYGDTTEIMALAGMWMVSLYFPTHQEWTLSIAPVVISLQQWRCLRNKKQKGFIKIQHVVLLVISIILSAHNCVVRIKSLFRIFHNFLMEVLSFSTFSTHSQALRNRKCVFWYLWICIFWTFHINGIKHSACFFFFSTMRPYFIHTRQHYITSLFGWIAWIPRFVYPGISWSTFEPFLLWRYCE